MCFRRIGRRLIAAVFVVVLCGCAGSPFHTTDLPQSLAVAPAYFDAEGRLSIRQAERSDHVNFEWQRSAAGERVFLTTPLGQGVAEISLDAAGAHLQRPGAAPVHAATFNDLAAGIFGVSVPLAELGDWLRGARGPAGNAGAWRIEITETRTGYGVQLPRRVEAANGELGFTILIDQWGAAQ